MFSLISVKNHISTTDAERAEVKEAARLTKCEIYDEIIKLYYYLTFSVNGKVQFDALYASLMKNAAQQLLDRFF